MLITRMDAAYLTFFIIIAAFVALSHAAAAENRPTSLFTLEGYEVVHSFVKVLNDTKHHIYVFEPKKTAKFPSTMTRYFYAPALFLDVRELSVRHNPFNNKWELHMPVVMWNPAYEEYIRERLSKHSSAPKFLLSILPLESVRMAPMQLPPPLQQVDRWQSYGNQAQTVIFRLYCNDERTCKEAVETIRGAAGAQALDFKAQFLLDGETVTEKVTLLKTERS
ncbi:uncharacterized protein LOC129597560 [Paramacrobiotus metropolitanus]|uniref:uncharacterized protein LOC129597560 n=1 Tax=Paramacrobiotus metropolitanus TaxID=2943436 RepID=UPI0024462E2E|nr:uncharacterized protein LOC129597560 [Paramacrobiotus metropolitanus]